MKTILKNIFILIILALSFVGVIGGIGFSVYNGGYLIAFGIIALTYCAYPQLKTMFKSFL